MSPEEQLSNVGTRFRYRMSSGKWTNWMITMVSADGNGTHAFCVSTATGGSAWEKIVDLCRDHSLGDIVFGWGDEAQPTEQAPAPPPSPEPGRCWHCREPNQYLPTNAVYLCTTCSHDAWRREQFTEAQGMTPADARKALGI